MTSGNVPGVYGDLNRAVTRQPGAAHALLCKPPVHRHRLAGAPQKPPWRPQSTGASKPVEARIIRPGQRHDISRKASPRYFPGIEAKASGGTRSGMDSRWDAGRGSAQLRQEAMAEAGQGARAAAPTAAELAVPCRSATAASSSAGGAEPAIRPHGRPASTSLSVISPAPGSRTPSRRTCTGR